MPGLDVLALSKHFRPLSRGAVLIELSILRPCRQKSCLNGNEASLRQRRSYVPRATFRLTYPGRPHVCVGSKAADHGWAAVPSGCSRAPADVNGKSSAGKGSAHAPARSWPPASNGGRLGGRDNLVGPGPATISRSAPFFPVSAAGAGRCRVARRDVRRRLCLAAKERVPCGVTGHRSASASRPDCAA